MNRCRQAIAEGGGLSLHSEVLGLDIRLEKGGLRFYDPATGQKLLNDQEIEQVCQQAEQSRQEAEQQLQQEAIARQALEARLAELEVQLRRQEGEGLHRRQVKDKVQTGLMGTLRFAHPTPTGSLPFNDLALKLARMGKVRRRDKKAIVTATKGREALITLHRLCSLQATLELVFIHTKRLKP